MKKTGLSQNQEKLLAILEYMKIRAIKRENLIGLISRYRIAKNNRYLIKTMLLKRRLVSFKRSNYLVVPMRSVEKTAEINEFELNEFFLGSTPYYIGLNNAFNRHGFTDQVFNKMFVFNTRYSFDKAILNYRFKYFKVKKEKFFGILKSKYPYSDRERTIIDALEYPRYLGGLFAVMDCVKDTKFHKSRLADYAVRYGSVKIMKLVGYLTNSRNLYALLKKKKALDYYTTIKSKIFFIDKRWKIRMT